MYHEYDRSSHPRLFNRHVDGDHPAHPLDHPRRHHRRRRRRGGHVHRRMPSPISGRWSIPDFFSKGQSFGKRTQKIKVVDVTDRRSRAASSGGSCASCSRPTLLISTVGFYLVVCGIMASLAPRRTHDPRPGLPHQSHLPHPSTSAIAKALPIEQTPAMKKRMEGSSHD
ncbi:MAG: hypothetical protein MZU97_10040 [Bacillus subtilis]|nr:hypothetical protein [Bacillus subtilis]